MINFIKKNGFGIVMSAGVGFITYLMYKAGTYDGWLEGYGEGLTILNDTLKEVAEKESE